jgi:carbamoylphosphate synthase small subunit
VAGDHALKKDRIPNLDRGIKARYLTKDVRIRGKQKGTTIWVEKLEAKERQKYRLVWDIQKQRKVEQAP